jgi:pyruvate/2-oxoglutarate dehydrogenase complex dihydrolipoamide acyltransferase (E2) component
MHAHSLAHLTSLMSALSLPPSLPRQPECNQPHAARMQPTPCDACQVTIDIKAAEAGFITEMLVAEGAIVKPGQVVAHIGAEAGPPEFKSSMADPPLVGVPPVMARAAAAAAPAPAASSASSHHRVPSISFPPRRTLAGERISDLPADKQAEALRQLASTSGAASSSHAAPAPAPSAPAAAPKPASALGFGAASLPAAPGKPAVAKVVLPAWQAPARRGMTAKEMESINSGGA